MAAIPNWRSSPQYGHVLKFHSSVPTNDDILVPETLLKKRKSQEKAREERSAELEKKKKVSRHFSGIHGGIGGLL